MTRKIERGKPEATAVRGHEKAQKGTKPETAAEGR
jgi:hypothetical protein